MNDSDRLDWFEAQHTLHGGVDVLYVVDGYEVQLTVDDAPIGPAHKGETLRDAIDKAFDAQWSVGK